MSSRPGQSVLVLEIVDEDDAVVRAWYVPAGDDEPTFVDLWIRGIDTSKLVKDSPARLPEVFEVTGNELFDTTCGKRSLPRLEPAQK